MFLIISKCLKDFVVPENDSNYPEHTWNVNLGKALLTIRYNGAFREHKDRLVALGVDFNVDKLNVVGFDVTYSALKVYKDIHGDLLVPQKFVVPENDDQYPKEAHGLKLGRRVESIRNQGTYVEHREQLEALGFVYDLKQYHKTHKKQGTK